MMPLRTSGAWRALLALRRDRRGSSAVEFALICAPLLFSVLVILQVGIYFMTQAALDSGVNAQGDALNNTFLSQTAPQTPTVAQLQSTIAAKGTGLLTASSLLVDLQPFSNLTAAAVAIGGNPPNIGSAGTCTNQSGCGGTVLALRAQSPVITFAPFFGTALKVKSSVLVRRLSQ